MKRIWLSVLAIGLAACSTQNPGRVESVRYDATSEVRLIDLPWLESFEIVPLETSDSCLIGGDLELIEDREEYYVVDKRQHAVYRFASDGRFLNRIGHMGKGPQEYLQVKDVRIDPDSNWVYVYSLLNKEEIVYTKEGEFIERRGIDYLPQKIFRSGSDTWLYLGYNNLARHGRIVELNEQGNIEREFLPAEAQILPVDEDKPVFVSGADRLFVRETMSSDIQELTDTGLRVAYHFDYGEYQLPDSYFEMKDPNAAAMFLMKHSFATNRQFWANDDYAVIMATIQKPQEKKMVIAYGIQRKADNQWEWINYSMPDDMDDIFMGSLKALNDQSELLFLVSASTLLSSPYMESPLCVNPEVLKTIQPDDNSVVVRCRLK